MNAELRLSFLPANAMFAFTFGTALVRLEDKSGPFPMFYPSQDEATRAAKLCGLLVRPSGGIEIIAA